MNNLDNLRAFIKNRDFKIKAIEARLDLSIGTIGHFLTGKRGLGVAEDKVFEHFKAQYGYDPKIAYKAAI